MAYYKEDVQGPKSYEWRERTLNSYWCIKPEARSRIEEELGWGDNPLLHACTRKNSHKCTACGMCKEMYNLWKNKKNYGPAYNLF